jgi:hypothetical protein
MRHRVRPWAREELLLDYRGRSASFPDYGNISSGMRPRGDRPVALTTLPYSGGYTILTAKNSRRLGKSVVLAFLGFRGFGFFHLFLDLFGSLLPRIFDIVLSILQLFVYQ